METVYKVFTKDWTSPDNRYHYKKGDKELVFPDIKSDEFEVIGADVGVIYEVPKEYLEDKYYGQVEQDDNLNKDFRELHKKLVNTVAEWCKEHNVEIDDFSLCADGFAESCKRGEWVSATDSSFSCRKLSDEYKKAFWDLDLSYMDEFDRIEAESRIPYMYSM